MNVVVTPRALKRFRRTMDLLFSEVPKEVSDRVTDRLFDHITLLSRFPGLGQQEPALVMLEQSHRRLIVGHFKVIYRVDGNTVVVVDIFDARQDPDRMKP